MDDTYTTTYQDAYDTAYSSSSTADPAAAAAVLGLMGIYMLVMLVVAVVSTISLWKLFEKAGKPGWAALVPVYNYIVLMEVIGRPLWWVAMLFVPVANAVFLCLTFIDFAKSYGKDTVYGILLVLFSPIMLPIMAFSKQTTYLGPVGPERHSVAVPPTNAQ